MKKYSSEFFEKKFRTLFNKLLYKEGFLSATKDTRKKLGLPENGFNNEAQLAAFFLSKMSRRRQFLVRFSAFADIYMAKNKLAMENVDGEKITDAFAREIQNKKNDKIEMVETVFWLGKEISDHNHMITKNPIIEGDKFAFMFFAETIKLIRLFWSLDLLDEHIMGYFVERYLFLGEYGVNQYIRNKISCSNCKYIGVDHFSPERGHMEGQNEGPYSKNYVFNKATVKRLSMFFHSVFLIIKPYATKEEVLQYVEDNWNSLKEHVTEKNTFYKQFDVHPSKIKESDFERNLLIYELYKLSKKEVLKRYKGEKDFSGKGVYKEAIISALLREQYEIDMSSDAIKKAASRFAKETRGKRIPKDIRDI